MKRITIEDVVEVPGIMPGRCAYRAHYSIGNGRVYTVLIPAEVVTFVDDIPDPLPTEVGTHIAALVRNNGVTLRTVLVLADGLNRKYPWRSINDVGGGFWHGPEHISDWRILDLDADA